MVTITKGKTPELSLLRDPSFGVPTDVTFQIIWSNIDDDQDVIGEVKGHKVILAAFSEVFRKMFFGPLKENKDTIPVKQTTLESFEMLFDFIYNKDIDWSDISILKMFDIINIANKYRIPTLTEEVMIQMENVKLTLQNVMEVAHTAAQFTKFPDASSHLLMTCAKFVQMKMYSERKQLQFAVDQLGTGYEVTVLQLMALVMKLPSIECSNCGQKECQNNKVVGISSFKIGLK